MSVETENTLTNLTKAFGKHRLVIPAGVTGILLVMVLPMPAMILDLLISLNITFSILILLVSMYIQTPVSFSVFPSLFLIITLFRLALNIASTRLILLDGAGGEEAAGRVIQSFGHFFIGGNYFVGITVFLVLIAIQYIVISHGATRTSEVTARFTLDAMPGKLTAVDADMKDGIIDENEARERRRRISRDSEFYGALDGAIHLTARDAVASVIIVTINIIGGFLIGVTQFGMELDEAARRFTILTVGDGLINAIPSLLVSVAGGIITTRAASETNLGQEVTGRLFNNPVPVAIVSGFLFFFGMIPGIPMMPFFILGTVTALMAYQSKSMQKEAESIRTKAEGEKDAEEKPKERIESLLKVDLLGIEIGYELLRYVDATQGGDFLERIKSIRRQIALELGLIIPPVHITDNLQLNPKQYAILLKGVQIARGDLMQDHLLAINPGTAHEEIPGTETIEPASGFQARWIKVQEKERAQSAGYTLVDPATVLATHLTEIIKSNAYELLGRKETKNLLDMVAETHPEVVGDLVPKVLSTGDVQKVLQNLLKEKVSIRDSVTILETLADYGTFTKNTSNLTEYCRQTLGRAICKPYQSAAGDLQVFTVSPELEKSIQDRVVNSEQGPYLALEPEQARDIMTRFRNIVDTAGASGKQVVLCSSNVRLYIRQLLERFLPNVAILAHSEIPQNIRILSMGMVI